MSSDSSDDVDESPNSSPSKPVHKMTYEEIRAANIERNNAKLRELFGTDKVTFMGQEPKRSKGSSGGGGDDDVPRSFHTRTHALPPLEGDELDAALQTLIQRFPCRKVELGKIWGYLNVNFCPSPALLVQGPSGCGKSDLSYEAVVSMRLAHIRVACEGFSTQKQLMRHMWYEIIAALLAGSKTTTWPTAKAPNNFSDLVGSLRTLLESLRLPQDAKRPQPTAKLCIVLDDVDRADDLDKGLTFRLLCLSELCHGSIKVVATLPALQRKPYPCILLAMQAYNLSQIKEIVIHKTGAGSNNSFSAVLNDVLLRLVSVTNHLGEILEVALVLYNNLSAQVETETRLSTKAASAFVMEQLHKPVMHMSRGTKRPAVEPLESSSSLRGASSCVDLPLSIKYLMLAVFLAAHIDKSSDDEVFNQRQKGRRKKGKKGSTVAEVAAAAVDAVAASRSFTLDRLLSIFAQICCIGGISSLGGGERAALALGRGAGLPELNANWVKDQIEELYGDARLFSAINDLEAQRYLVRGPGWTLEMPTYVSAVTYKLALDISLTLSFNIDAFLTR